MTICYRASALLSPSDFTDINGLLNELSSASHSFTQAQLKDVARGYFYLARDDSGHIVGMATLVPYHKPTGYVGLVEDVVVTEACRGQGNGRALMEKVISDARLLGIERLDLTSNPARTAAQALYRSLGFRERNTSCFELKL